MSTDDTEIEIDERRLDRLEEARNRMTETAIGLAGVLGTADAAAVLAAATITLLENFLGPSGLNQTFRTL